MSFEFFFGIFGLISSDLKSRHQSRLDTDWRLFSPSGANLFKDGQPSVFAGLASQKLATPATKGVDSPREPIFSTQQPHQQQQQHSSSASEGVFSSGSNSSAASLVSQSSSSTLGSGASLINKKATEASKGGGQKYELRDRTATKRGQVSPLGMNLDEQSELSSGEQQKQASSHNSFRVLYCRAVCGSLWLFVLRLLLGLVLDKSILTLDLFYLRAYRIHFLIPALCVAIQVAAVSLIFIRNNDETNWLVPFYSKEDYLIRSRSNFRPKIEDYTRRVNISVALALLLATLSSLSMATYLSHCVLEVDSMKTASSSASGLSTVTTTTTVPVGNNQTGDFWMDILSGNLNPHSERLILSFLLLLDVLWALYSTYICFLVAFYFNLICSIMKSRFQGISKIIEDLAESNTSKTTNQARKITTLYLEHNEACELLDESNDFWQYLIFFTYFTYIPAYCYCLYNLFFVDFEAWPSFITWVIHFHTGFIILLISFSAAGVSTEAHAPYTSLHTLSLIQLPLDVEVNIATFLHRVRGLTIGYSCYDLFAITNASMSNTAAACASYFLIVADFSRSSVFNISQMNGSSTVAQAGGLNGSAKPIA